MRFTTSVLCVAASAMLVAGCGGSSNNGSAAPAPTPSTPSTPSTPAAPAASPTITISGMAFSPLNLHVPAGATVTVVNKDGFDHTVTSETAANMFTPGSVGGVQFDTGLFTGTRTFSVPANAATGTVVPYYCKVHLATMATPTGTITIDPSAATTTSSTPAPAPAPPSMPGY
jgi:plastocyanin